MPQARLKILSAAAKNRCSPINTYLRKKKKMVRATPGCGVSAAKVETLHRQRVGRLRREAPKYSVVHFYRVGNFIG